MQKINLKIGSLRLIAETREENPQTLKTILENLPINGEALRWGEEIYFYVQLKLPTEQAKTTMKVGEIAYWPEGPGIAIFFGKTPASKGAAPEAYSPVNAFARLKLSKNDIKQLSRVKDGTKISLEKA